jgi:hypothetical protein
MYYVRLLFPGEHVIGLGQGAAVTALENDFLVPLFFCHFSTNFGIIWS